MRREIKLLIKERYMNRILAVLTLLLFHPTGVASETEVPLGMEQFAEEVTLDYLSEFSTRRRLTTFFANEQSPFYGVQMNFVNVGKGNFTFLNRDLVRVDRMPIVFGRVYDSSNRTDSDFGPGWKLTVSEHIMQEGDIYTYTDAGNSNFQLKNKSGALVSDYPRLTGIEGGSIHAHSITLNLVNGQTKEFELLGDSYKLTRVLDTDGNSIVLQYSDENVLNAVLSQSGGFVKIYRDSTGKITSAEDDHGRSVTFAYDEQSRLRNYTELGGGQWVYGYDKQDNLASATDPRGVMILNASYENDVATGVRILHDRMKFRYSGNTTRVSNSLQQEATFWQDSSGLTESVQGFSGDITGFSFNNELNPVSLNFNGESIARFSYDGANLTSFERTQAGEAETERYIYQQNKLAYIEQNESVVARYSYDQLGRVAEASDDVGTRSYQYHSDGRIGSITWGDQHYEIQTNQTGQIEQIISNGEQWIGIDYNPQGSVARIDRFFNDEYQPMEFNYDNRGFRTTSNYNGTEIEISYDMVGNLTSMSYPSEQGRAIDQYLVGENNELIQVLHAEESAVYIAYDAVGRPINITKGSRILSVEYDQAGRVVDVSMNGNPFVHKSYDSKESNADLDFEERGSSTTGAHPVDLSLEGSPFVNKTYDAMDSDAVLSSDKRTSFTTVPYPMASSIFGSIDGIVYSRLRGTAHGPVRFDAQMARFVLHSAPPVPDIVALASLQRRMLTPLGREFVPSPFMFDKPSNSLFLPPEFASVNCQICLGDDTTTVALSAFTPFIAQQSESVYASISGGSCTNFLDIQIPLAHRVTFGDGTSGYGNGSDITFNHIWSNPGLYTVSKRSVEACLSSIARRQQI